MYDHLAHYTYLHDRHQELLRQARHESLVRFAVRARRRRRRAEQARRDLHHAAESVISAGTGADRPAVPAGR